MCFWIKYTSYQWCWQGWRLFLMSTAIKLTCTWQDIKRKAIPLKQKLNVKKKFTVVCINSMWSLTGTISTLTAHECPLQILKNKIYTTHGSGPASPPLTRLEGRCCGVCSWNTDTGGLSNSSWEGAKSFIRCYNQQMPFINGKENHKHIIYFWASWTAHMIGLKMEVIDYDTSPNKAVPKWLFLGLFCDHTPGRCYRSAGIGFLLLCRFQNLKRQRCHLVRSFSCLPVKSNSLVKALHGSSGQVSKCFLLWARSGLGISCSRAHSSGSSWQPTALPGWFNSRIQQLPISHQQSYYVFEDVSAHTALSTCDSCKDLFEISPTVI